MKRIIGAAAAGVVAFSGIYALAASLSVSSNSLGAGTSVVAACQSATLNATYVPESYSTTIPGYTTAAVTVQGLANTCYGVPYRVTVYGSGNASLGESIGTTPATGTTFTATLPGAVNAASITGVAIVLGG